MSIEQGVESSQLLGPPGWQFPPLQTSSSVQKLPSWQVPATKLLRHVPVARSQESPVQRLPSSQLNEVKLHSPVAGLQESTVHGFPSAQPRGEPWQMGAPPGVPAAQMSPVVQRFESSQGDPGSCGVPAHCADSEQVSERVQGFPSSQVVSAGRAAPRH